MSSQGYNWHLSSLDDHHFQIHGSTFFYAAVLFSIIFVITIIIIIYAHSKCSFRCFSSSPSPHLDHAPQPSQPQGLDAATISSFPIVLNDSSKSSTGGGSECCICLGLFQDGEKVKVLPNCLHRYHSLCVDKWLCSQSSCPICRSSLRTDSPV